MPELAPPTPSTPAPPLTPQRPPPPDYYAGNLRLMLDHVEAFYHDLLSDRERDFIRALQGLDADAQRLYARLLGRKGPWIRIDKLAYPEVSDQTAALDTLTLAGLITVNEAAPADALLGLFTQSERRTLFPSIAPANKTEWITHCVSRFSDHQIQKCLMGSQSWLAVADYDLVRLSYLLFFGDDHQDTSTLILQDLGFVRYEPYPLTPAQRLFSDRDALQRFQTLRGLSGLSHRLAEHPQLPTRLLDTLRLPVQNRLEQRQKDRTLNRLGRWFERQGDFDRALESYALSRTHPSRERRARMLKKLGDLDGAQRLAARMGAQPRCAEELDFSQRFGARQTFTVETTELPLRQAPTIRIEAYSANLLSASGGSVFHLENSFPLALAGLAFWEEIFSPIPGAFSNPFQNGPLDMFWPDFASTRAAELDARTATLSAPGVFSQALRETYASRSGVANRLVSWRHFSTEVLDAVLTNIPADALLTIASYVIRWPYRTRNGFPDLVVIYGPGSYEFVEVKGPTDQLQPAQRIWLQALADMNQPARVLKFKTC